MDLALLASTFATVFLAELGDKTQLAIVTISGTSSRPGAVFAGSSAALVLASLLGAAAGGSLSTVIPTNTLQLAASVGFLVLGLRLLLMARAEEDTAARETANLMGSAGSTADDQSVP
ncbi:transmembrane protein [Cyanobium sp. PCC 7001]|uniref:TMEM165/GDT1 family protein n=1 Tax=Cyanobium sp. PCC 7001 TaxID=180281 RepID=UPI000180566F|nr:TMEM165/GDT1 family protein [Cyanobium sp. PCC 7001]EDY38892.1 transmembrane protein [Cyanobium sp. PCC 7001]